MTQTAFDVAHALETEVQDMRRLVQELRGCTVEQKTAFAEHLLRLAKMSDDLKDIMSPRPVLVPPCEVPVLVFGGELPVTRRPFKLSRAFGFLSGAKA